MVIDLFQHTYSVKLPCQILPNINSLQPMVLKLYSATAIMDAETFTGSEDDLRLLKPSTTGVLRSKTLQCGHGMVILLRLIPSFSLCRKVVKRKLQNDLTSYNTYHNVLLWYSDSPKVPDSNMVFKTYMSNSFYISCNLWRVQPNMRQPQVTTWTWQSVRYEKDQCTPAVWKISRCTEVIGTLEPKCKTWCEVRSSLKWGTIRKLVLKRLWCDFVCYYVHLFLNASPSPIKAFDPYCNRLQRLGMPFIHWVTQTSFISVITFITYEVRNNCRIRAERWCLCKQSGKTKGMSSLLFVKIRSTLLCQTDSQQMQLNIFEMDNPAANQDALHYIYKKNPINER